MPKPYNAAFKPRATSKGESCGLCGSKGTNPEALDPVILGAYSSCNSCYVCLECYDDLRPLADYQHEADEENDDEHDEPQGSSLKIRVLKRNPFLG